MIDIQSALKLAADNFPRGPEAVANAIEAVVEYSELSGAGVT